MLNILLIIFISFIPVIFWAYIFSNIDENPINKKRFLIWIISWWLSVVPILYMDSIIEFIKLKNLNFFNLAYNIKDLFSSLNFSFWLSLFLMIILILSWILAFMIKKNINILRTYIKAIFIFLLFILLIWVIFYSIDLFSSYFIFLNYDIWESKNIYFWETVFSTIKLIIFYYIIVAFIEEATKHFNFIWTSILDIRNVNEGVIYAIFVALWFSFVENILYFNNLYLSTWFSWELVQTYFFRSIFSIIVHVYCSVVVSYAFVKSYLLFKQNNKIFPYLKTFIKGLFYWILLHFIFDFTLTLGFTMIIIIYFVIWYLYVSSIFYKEE